MTMMVMLMVVVVMTMTMMVELMKLLNLEEGDVHFLKLVPEYFDQNWVEKKLGWVDKKERTSVLARAQMSDDKDKA